VKWPTPSTTQTVLAGLGVYPPAANFLWCFSAQNYENWLTADKIIGLQ